jgi:hypothetical protein
MSEHTKLFEGAAARYEAPDLPMADLLKRRDRKRRNERVAAGVVGITVFVAAIWVVMTGGPFDRSQTPTSTGPPITGPTVARDYPGPVGLQGVPPDVATPSTPISGEMVLSFGFGHTDGDGGRFHLTMYQDGRLIWERLGDPSGEGEPTGLIEQRLTPAGVELVRSEVLSTGLFDRDLRFEDAPGLHYGQIEILDGDRLASICWGPIYSGDGHEGVPTATPTREHVDASQLIDTRLEDLASWLPATAWEDAELRPYVPSRFSICYETGIGIGLEGVLDKLPQPAQDLLRHLERTHEEFGRSGPATTFEAWCSTVMTQHARELARILGEAGWTQLDRAPEIAYASEREVSVGITIGFVPLLPHEPCDQARCPQGVPE